MLNLPSDSPISPTIWLHGSGILLILLLVKRFGYEIKPVLSLNSTHWRWFFVTLFVAVVYWLFDHWLMSRIFDIDTAAAIKSWQIANNKYHISTVFISSVILAPVFEELFFRGLIFNQLSRKINVWVAAVLSAFFFAAIHWSWPEFLSLFVAALIYTYLLKRSNSLTVPLTAHVTHNFLTFLYYF